MIALANAPSGRDGGMASGSFRPCKVQRPSPFAANRAYPAPIVESALLSFNATPSERREALLARKDIRNAIALVDPELSKFVDGDYNSHGRPDRRDSFYTYWETPVESYGGKLYSTYQTEMMILEALLSDKIVIELGIGGGTPWLNFFAKHKLGLPPNFYGTALTPTFTSELDSRVLICDASKLHFLFEQNSVGLVLSHYGIYGSNTHKQHSLKSIAHVLKPGGSALLRVAGDMSDGIHEVFFSPASERKPIELVSDGPNRWAYYNETSLTLPHFWHAHIKKV